MGSKTIGSLLVRIGMDAKDADKSLKQFEKNLRDTGRRMESIGRAMSIGFTTPFLLGIGKAIQSYSEEAKAVRGLQIALGGTSKALLDQAAALQKVTTFADDEIIAQQAWAAALGHTESQIMDMTTAAVGLSAGLGMGLNEAMKALHQTTTGSARTLGRLIPEIKNMTEEQLKSGEAIELVNKKFAGFAEALALTGDGPLKVLKNQFGDLSEEIGKVALPVILTLTRVISGMITAIQGWSEEQKKAVVGIGLLVAAIGPLLLVIPKIIKSFLWLISPIGIITASIVALGAAAIWVAYNWDKFVDDWKIIWWEIKNIAVSIINDVIAATNLMIKAVNPLAALTGKGLISYVDSPSTSGVNVGNSDRANMYSRGTQYKGFGEVMNQFGGDLLNLAGYDEGVAKLKEAEAAINNIVGGLDRAGDSADKAATSIAKVSGAMGEGRSPFSGIAGMSTGIFNGQSSSKQELTPASDWAGVSDGWKDGLKDQAATVNDLTESWFTLADGIGLATGMIDGFLSEGGKSFGKYALEALKGAMQVARAKMIEIAVNVVAGSSKAGLPGLIAGIVGATAGIALIGKLLSGIQAPALAQGGQTVGPTMALIGDNPSGKEMVLPFERTGEFARAIGSQIGGGGSRVVGVIRGRDIHLVTSQEQGYASRRGSGNLITF